MIILRPGLGVFEPHALLPLLCVVIYALYNLLTPEIAGFKQLDKQAHDLSLLISAAAKQHDRDRAIADYQRMVTGCLDCHAAYKDRLAAALVKTAP